jgi:hypothetical protein
VLALSREVLEKQAARVDHDRTNTMSDFLQRGRVE